MLVLFGTFFDFFVHFGELVFCNLRYEGELVFCSSLVAGVEGLRVEEGLLAGVCDLAEGIFFVKIAINFLKAV